MKIGLSVPLAHETPQQWAKKHRELGCGSVVFPVNCEASPETIDAYRKAAEQEGLIIAEVGIWKNVLAVDNREREEAVAYSINQLKMADEIGAKYCWYTAWTDLGWWISREFFQRDVENGS